MKVGDRVRATAPSWGEDTVPVGAVGTVVQAPPLLAVAFDRDPIGDGTGAWAMSESQVAHLHPLPARIALRWLRRRGLFPAVPTFPIASYRAGT